MKELFLKLKNKKWFSLTMLIFPITLIYQEIVLKASTVGGVFNLSTVFMVLFCISIGMVGYVLSTLFKSRLVNNIISIAFMSISAIIYLVEYFVFRYFKVFYDVNTVVAGAGDAVGDFLGEIYGLVFCWDGCLKFLLFFLPAILYAVCLCKIVPSNRSDAAKRTTAVVSMIIVHLVTVITLGQSNIYGPVYNDQYNFQSAVENFGLYTGLRLDICNYFSGNADISFESTPEQVEGNTTKEPEEDISSENIVVPEVKYNMLELDFSKKANKDITKLNEYVQSISASKQNEYTGLFKGKNLIMLTAEAFTAEFIDAELTPTLYRLANKGINFTDYYQPSNSGTTGGEYQNVFGLLSTSAGMSFKKTADKYNYYTMGSQLDRLGYYGMAYHNNSYTYYSRNLTHVNLGYSNGFMGYGNGMEKYVKNCWPQSDLEMIAGTLPTYIDKQPFNIYYMTVSGHSGYSKEGNMMTYRNWDMVKDLPYSDTVKGYFAANLELEKALGYLVAELEKNGIADDTVICIATDHFPYGLDRNGTFGNMPYLSELYGFNVTNHFERDHSRLIIWSGCLEDKEPIVVSSPTSSLDILPTLSNLFGTEFDSRLLVGRDVFSDAEALVFNHNYDWKTELGTYTQSKGEFVPVSEYVEIPEGYVDRIKSIVRNKIRYCALMADNDYYEYLFKK